MAVKFQHKNSFVAPVFLSRLCGGEVPSDALTAFFDFLSRLCGGEVVDSLEIGERDFLSRLCGGEVHR